LYPSFPADKWEERVADPHLIDLDLQHRGEDNNCRDNYRSYHDERYGYEPFIAHWHLTPRLSKYQLHIQRIDEDSGHHQ